MQRQVYVDRRGIIKREGKGGTLHVRRVFPGNSVATCCTVGKCVPRHRDCLPAVTGGTKTGRAQNWKCFYKKYILANFVGKQANLRCMMCGTFRVIRTADILCKRILNINALLVLIGGESFRPVPPGRLREKRGIFPLPRCNNLSQEL